MSIFKQKNPLWATDSSVPLMHHDPSDIGLMYLEKKLKISFGLLKNLNLDFLKETHPTLSEHIGLK